MLYDSPLHESRAWDEAGEEAWAQYDTQHAAAVYAAAVARREREAGTVKRGEVPA